MRKVVLVLVALALAPALAQAADLPARASAAVSNGQGGAWDPTKPHDTLAQGALDARGADGSWQNLAAARLDVAQVEPGAGVAHTMQVRFYDENGREFNPGTSPADAPRLRRMAVTFNLSADGDHAQSESFAYLTTPRL